MLPDLPRLTVAIVTYDSEKQIARCLESLARAAEGFQTVVRVVDNASRDRTVRVVEALAKKFRRPSFRVELQRLPRNEGFTRAMNRAVLPTGDDAVLWLNPDAYPTPGALRTLWDSLLQDPHRGAVAPQLLNPDGSIQPSCRRFPLYRDVFFEIAGLARLFPHSPLFARWKMGDFDHRTARRVDQPQGAFLLFRGDLVRALGPLDERFEMFFSDVDYCRRTYEAGYHIWFEPAAQAIHEKGASVYLERRRTIRQSHRDMLRYFRKWHGAGAGRLLLPLLAAALALILPVRLVAARNRRRREERPKNPENGQKASRLRPASA